MIKLIRNTLLTSTVGLWLMACSSGEITPTKLTCEHQENPSVLDVTTPRLSWVNEQTTHATGTKQSAWEIRVASSRQKLKEGDMWQSSKTNSDQSILISYAGKPLESGRTYWWQVRVWDDKGQPSKWSKPASWTMGILNPSEWKCEWIGAPWQGELAETEAEMPNPPAPLLRKAFQVNKKVAEAKFFGTGLGYFELYLNGQKVSDDCLVPAQTNYDRRPKLIERSIPVEDNFTEYRVMYLGYDLTSLMQQGENVVGAILGNGFYNANSRWVMPYGSPRFFGQIIVRYTDGTEEIIGSDSSWQVAKSAIVSDGVYGGEHYDARLEHTNWCTSNYDASDWQQAAIRKAPYGHLVAQNGPTDKVTASYQPTSIQKLGEGHFKVSFPEEISGWAHLKGIQGNSGDKIEIQYHSESELGTNSYTLSGKGNEEYAARFTWFVFSELEVKGWNGELTAANITAEAVNTQAPQAGHFACSNELFNQINQIFLRSQWDNMHGSIASDCPHRERSAYTGDGQAACISVMHNLDVAAFYNKWIADMRGAQNVESGYVPNGAPWQPGCGGGVAWGAAMNIMPWEYYKMYGDKQILTENYQAMKDQVRYMTRWVEADGTMHSNYPVYWMNLGDWVPPGEMVDDALVHTFYYWRCCDFMAHTAHALSNKEDEATYRQMAEEAKAAFHRKFYDPEKGSYGAYGGNVFALCMGVPTEQHEKVVEALKNDLEAAGEHLDTGIFGTQLLFETLTENGLHELAYRIMNQRDFPSFGWWIEQGATTTWEQWDGKNSRNHPMFGGSLTWFYRHVAGMQIDENEPGYKHIIFSPTFSQSLTWASYSKETPYGLAAIRWERDAEGIQVDITVPVGSTATVNLPGLPKETVSSGKYKFHIQQS